MKKTIGIILLNKVLFIGVALVVVGLLSVNSANVCSSNRNNSIPARPMNPRMDQACIKQSFSYPAKTTGILLIVGSLCLTFGILNSRQKHA
jgi:hypothetical protein